MRNQHEENGEPHRILTIPLYGHIIATHRRLILMKS